MFFIYFILKLIQLKVTYKILPKAVEDTFNRSKTGQTDY